jgi:AcrR family transcriptional regulator
VAPDSRIFPEEDAVEEPPGEAHVHNVLVAEVGEPMAAALTRARSARESAHLQLHPHDGLRERKKRLTRQRISDVASALFVFRGFDNVRVSDVAEVVGVSEKTIYNYFPTKESMVFDMADEDVERITRALRERAEGESPTRAVLRALIADLEHLTLTEGIELFLPAFAEMIESTPSLRAAWLEIHARLIAVVVEELAASADVDPRTPEAMIAARAIVSLQDIAFETLVRQVGEGVWGTELRDSVIDALERAARLLETGLWSFKLLATAGGTRRQLQEATAAADQARKQVLKALKDARAAWREAHRRERTDIKHGGGERAAAAHRRAERDAARVGRQDAKESRKAQQPWQAARALAKQAAREALREALRDEALREALRERSSGR